MRYLAGLFVSLAFSTLQAATMLVYGPTAGCIADGTPGYTVTIWSAATWATKTTADFAAFDVIVFGDCPSCGVDESTWAAAIANASVWSNAVTGNKIVIGTDPDLHTYVPGVTSLIHDMVDFAANDSDPGPGLYVALSCAYNYSSPVPVPLLSAFGAFTAVGSGCGDAVRKLAVHPALVGVTDAGLSNWGCSTHEGFTAWPAGWLPLAMTTDSPSKPYTAADGSQGLVYILAAGDSVVSIFSPTFTPPFSPSPTWTASPSFTQSPTWSITPTITPTPTVTATWTASPSSTPTPTWTHTPSITQTRTVTATLTTTLTSTLTVSHTITPTFSASPTVTATVTQTPRPLLLKLLPPNPNPSDGSGQWLPYFLSVDARTDISIYTIAGEVVRRLDPRDDLAGYREQFWDNRNDSGRPVASGVFIYRVRARSARDEEKQDFSKCAVTR